MAPHIVRSVLSSAALCPTSKLCPAALYGYLLTSSRVHYLRLAVKNLIYDCNPLCVGREVVLPLHYSNV
jgi:hypothetical protein